MGFLLQTIISISRIKVLTGAGIPRAAAKKMLKIFPLTAGFPQLKLDESKNPGAGVCNRH
jgi:hypothetical protein